MKSVSNTIRTLAKHKATKYSLFLFTTFAALLTPASAAAQSCALCYTQASSAGARMIEALRSGILVLIIPPTLMTVGMFFIIHRKTYQYRNSEGEIDTQASDSQTH